jgi:hypothetical protein
MMKTEKITRVVERFFPTVDTRESPIDERGMYDPPRRAGSFQRERRFPLSLSGRFTQRLTYLAILSGLTTFAHGQLNFSTPPTYAGNGNFFVANFNGKPGILTADGTINLGNGDGTFKTGTTVTGTPVAVADFNGDGKPDVLEVGTGTVQVLLGNGDGTFQATIVTNVGANLTLVTAADLNGDGKADVAGIFNNNLYIFLSNGDGTFGTGTPYSLGTNSPGIILFADFNGDGKTDILLVPTFGTGPEVVLLGNGDGTFQPALITSVGLPNSAVSVVVGDFNGDGKLDLATGVVVTGAGNTQVSTVLLQLGNGDGTFQSPTTAFTGPFGWGGLIATLGLAAADVNGDGKLDLVLSGTLIAVYLGNGDGTFSANPNYYEPLGFGGTQVAIADFNLDGKLDIATDSEILLGNGNGRFQGPPTVLLPSAGAGAVTGKFVTNGAPGVAVISSSLFILTNDGTGFLTLANTYTLPQPPLGIATADLNGDGKLDLLVTGSDTNNNWSYSVLLGNGDGSFQPPVLYQQTVQGEPTRIVIADFNNDHKLDFAVPAGNQQFAVLLGNGDGTFAPPTYVFDGDGGVIVSADFNNDGNADIAEAGNSGLAIVLGKGDGTFQNAAFPANEITGNLVTADVNGDGNADLIGSGGGVQVLLGAGNGSFTSIPQTQYYETFLYPIALADLNGDGKPDLIGDWIPGLSGTFLTALGNGDGTFSSTYQFVPYSYPPHSYAPVFQVADMNGDGKPDLIIESSLSSVFVVINSTVTPSDFTISMASGSSSSSTISAGQSASFNLLFAASGPFSGTVALTCSLSPAATPAPTCSVPASVNVSGNTATPVMVTVGTTAAGSATSLPSIGFPRGIALLAWLLVLGVSGMLCVGKRPRSAFPAATMVLAFMSVVGCGGSSPTTTTTVTGSKGTPGTPAGTYTAMINATSGSLSHQLTLTVIVQ